MYLELLMNCLWPIFWLRGLRLVTDAQVSEDLFWLSKESVMMVNFPGCVSDLRFRFAV